MSQNFGQQMGKQASWQMLLMGVIFLVVGIAAYVTIGSVLALMSIIFVVVGVGMIGVGIYLRRGSAADQANLASSTLGSAQILSVTQTGMTLNEQPRIKFDLAVSLPGQAPYQVSHAEFVPLILLVRCQPGATVAVRVNPAKPDKVTISWNEMPPSAGGSAVPAGGYAGAPAGAGAESLAQVAAAMQSSGAAVAPVFAMPDQANYSVEELRQWVRQNGIPGTARIDQLSDAGQTVGNDRMMMMQTTLQVPGRPPFQGPLSAAMVPVDKIGRLAVGVTLPVLVAPNNPNLTMFEWDKI